MRTCRFIGLLALVICANCGGEEFSSGGTGGSSTGGLARGGEVSASGGAGGNPSTGGRLEIDGGASATGGSPSTGGTATGGTVVNVGGTSTGGTATGGTVVNVGGTSTGGAATGGTVVNVGGTSTGGAATGGRATGGTSTGGASTGGGANARGGTGMGGSGGSGGYPECTADKDCTMFTDCCSCEPIPVGATRDSCPTMCVVDNCTSRSIGLNEVACVAGRCTFSRTCNPAGVICDVPTPLCDPGQLPLVNGACYGGGCAPVEDCADVASCEECKAAHLQCATFQVLPPSYHCVTTPLQCTTSIPICACMGICIGSMSCVQPNSTDLTCQCPNCA